MKTVLVTGANRGLGLEFCRQYAESGWKVLACCREPDRADALKKLAESHPEIALHRLDVSRFDEVDTLAQALAGQPIDFLIHNAGIYGDSERTPFGALDYTAWMKAMEINALAPVKLTEALLPQLELGSGKLVAALTTLMGSLADNRTGGSILYRSSKAALNMAMKTLSVDLRRRGIGVLLLHPGWVRTDMGGPNAITLPKESIAGMIKVMEAYQPGDSGKFLDFRGKELPW